MQDELINRLIDQVTARQILINQLQQTLMQQTQSLEYKDKRISELEQLIDALTLEKRSIESELENTRGY